MCPGKINKQNKKEKIEKRKGEMSFWMNTKRLRYVVNCLMC